MTTRRHLGRAGVALTLATVSLVVAPAAHAAVDGPAEPVIVSAASVAAATNAVGAAGGTVDLALPIVDAVAGHVGPAGLAALESDPSVDVAPDTTVHPTSASFSAAALDSQIAAMDPPADWSPDAGRGVAVALIDTGVADTPDLDGSRLVRGPDLSGEGDGIDHYGHGTFMAGLIAGDGAASADLPTRHYGVAPGATLVSVKVAGADGSSSVARVIAGIGWVVSHRDTYGIRVLNLSFGVDAPMPYFFNPLSAAVEAAWASGITVVASAGNEGDGHVTSPGSDPYVITVGAADTAGTSTIADDTVPSWSGRERFGLYAKPDVVAPGVSVVSLRAPGSTVDVTHPEGRVGTVYFRGTGTSMSTALTSGAAAVLLSEHPAATPDDIKGALVAGAMPIAGGAHEIDLDRSIHATAQPGWWQHYPVAFFGLGRGFFDGMPWTATRWSNTRWTMTRWTATDWTMTRWTDAEWTMTRWTNTRWTATRWSATRWSAQAWPSQSWG
jgi:serine protease AprX